MNKILTILAILVIPVISFAQVDTLSKSSIKSWVYTEAGVESEAVIDTTINGFQKVNPIFKSTLFANYLGNNGSPAQSLLFFDRDDDPKKFFFGRHVNNYFTHPEDIVYYNTTKPFTEVGHSAGGPRNESEQFLTAIHTQNVNPDFNIGIKYDLYTSKGRYVNHNSRGNYLTAFTSYKKGAYQIHANASYNNHEMGENGGIDSLHHLGNDDYPNSINIPVLLNQDSRSQIKNKSIFFEHGFEFDLVRKNKKTGEADHQQKIDGLYLSDSILLAESVNSIYIDSKKEKAYQEINFTEPELLDYSGIIQIDTLLLDSVKKANKEFIAYENHFNDSTERLLVSKVDSSDILSPEDSLKLRDLSAQRTNNNDKGIGEGDKKGAKSIPGLNDSKKKRQNGLGGEVATSNENNFTEEPEKALPRISFKHRFLYDYNIRKYVDESIDGKDTLLYGNFDEYINLVDTVHDEARMRMLYNKLSVDYNSENLFVQFAYNNYLKEFKHNIRDSIFYYVGDTLDWDTTIVRDKIRNIKSNSLSYHLNGKLFNSFFYESSGEYFFSGYRQEDIDFNARAGIKLPWLNGKLGSVWASYIFKETTPDYFQENFTSKHLWWDTSFLKIQKNILQFEYINKKYDLGIGAKFGEIKNYMYFDSTYSTRQYQKPLQVTEFYLTKNFHFWKLHLYNTAKYQISGNDSILKLPSYVINSSWYIEHHFHFKSTGGDLLTQLGVDFQYYSRYNADRYMPLTGVFYNQDKVRIGEYPYMDIFLNLKLKSVRLSVVYSNLFGLFNNPNYFVSPHYPASPATLKFNLIWTFYD